MAQITIKENNISLSKKKPSTKKEKKPIKTVTNKTSKVVSPKKTVSKETIKSENVNITSKKVDIDSKEANTKTKKVIPKFDYDKFENTSQISVSKKVVDQVIGQERAVEVIKNAAKQRRHVFLIGEPGTGKSMLGIALAELLPKEKLVDIISFPNPNDENKPLIRTLKAGEGRQLVLDSKIKGSVSMKNQSFLLLIIAVIAMVVPWWVRYKYQSDIMFAAFFLGGMLFLAMFAITMNLGKKMGGQVQSPKVIVDNYKKDQAPFFEATGAHAGALLGDVLHDPFQSGGLGTPANERVVAGMIHKANKGVLFIDEVATLQRHTQQELLSALQERKYSITGQSERSAGAMVRTEPVPCDFVLIAAGNLETIKDMHPALRSRIRGYGYEVHMDDTMPDTKKNREKLAVFVAQEVTKDEKIPHFTKAAVDLIVEEARRRAGRKHHLTLRLRDLGGIVRAAGDIAVERSHKFVTKTDVVDSFINARSLEKQIADKYIERKKEYEVIKTSGSVVGRVNGLAVIGAGSTNSGIILPIESQVTAGGKEKEIIATGKLGEIAKEAVKNVSAVIKRLFGEDIREKYDIYLQFLQTYEGVEGDSASIATAVAIISAINDLPIKQNLAMTGSLSVRGDVLPIGGATSKIQAAIEAGIQTVIVPKSNVDDIVISKEDLKKINIIPVSTIEEVLKEAFDWKNKKELFKKLKL